MKGRKGSVRILVLLVLCAVVSMAEAGQPAIGFSFRSDHADSLYMLGEEAAVTITVTNGEGKVVRTGWCRASVDNYGRKTVVPEVRYDLAQNNPFTLKGTLKAPGFLRFRVVAKTGEEPVVDAQWSVGFEPEKIRPATERPADFDAFWDAAVRRFDKTVPIDAQMLLDKAASNGSTHDCYRLAFATVPRGRVIRGSLTIPKGAGPWPVTMRVPGAGSGSWGYSYEKNRAFLLLNVLDYPCAPDAQHPVKVLYAEQNAKWGAKTGEGAANWYFHGDLSNGREDYFYYGAILGINRAVDWVSALPRIQPRSVWYYGQSQGGAFGIYLAALNANIVRAGIGEPAITDICGMLADGRQSGWPTLPEQYEGRPFFENMMKILPYFDCAHFVPRIKVPTRWFVGFSDALCPPHAVWAGYNCLKTADKKMENWPGLGHGTPDAFYRQAFDSWQESW